MRTLSTLLTLILAGAAGAAELPLGLVDSAEAGAVAVRFDASVRLAPGAMLAVYGPGKVEKHPLTHETIVERRQLVAKAQVVGGTGKDGLLRARVLWTSGVALAGGMDVVPLPGEAAPNAAPALTGALPAVSAPVSASVKVALPIGDPDGDALSYTWTLTGAPGVGGALSAHTTRRPEIRWTAPGLPGPATLHVVARDPLGQELAIDVPLAAIADDDWRKREAKPLARFGPGNQPGAARLRRDADGTWLGVDEGGGQVLRFAPGWAVVAPVAFATGAAPRRPLAAAGWKGDLYVLDGGANEVEVFGADGNRKSVVGPCQRPTDLAIAGDGTLFIADQGAGGVLVFEANGKFRARLGHDGKGDDAFTGLTRIALGPGGELYALDPAQGQIARFDRFQRRLDAWSLQVDAKNPPVDLAIHPKGLLVLLASGQVLIADGRGQATQSWKGLGEAGLVERVGNADGLFVDASGEVFVTYAGSQLIARHDADGLVTGVRGPGLWSESLYAADGRGRLFALETGSGMISVADGEGWRLARFGGTLRSGGPFSEASALAVTPDGQGLSVLDADKLQVVRWNLAKPQDKPVVFGQPGKNNGQFAKVTALACDAAGRTYVLDARQHRVQVFDAQGAFLYGFGRYERGKMPDELSEPTLIAVSPAGDAAYIYDEDTYEIKKFALDPAKATAAHVTNSGGKGDDPGQFRAVKGLGVDRLGLLYVADGKRGDLQVIDFRGSNAVAGPARKAADLGTARIAGLALAPDGQVYLPYDGTIAAWSW